MTNDITELIVDLLDKQSQIAALEEKTKALKKLLADNLDNNLGKHEFDNVYARLTLNARMDDKLAKTELPATVYASVSKTTLDTTKARKLLNADDIALITKVFEPKVEVGVIDNDDA